MRAAKPAAWIVLALALFAAMLITALVAWVGWKLPDGRTPRALAILTATMSVQVATLWSLVKSFHGDKNAAWEPTRRITINNAQSAV